MPVPGSFSERIRKKRAKPGIPRIEKSKIEKAEVEEAREREICKGEGRGIKPIVRFVFIY